MNTWLTPLFRSRRSSPKVGRRPPFRPQLDQLEDRCVPATLNFVNGALQYTPTAGIANNLTIAKVGSNYSFNDTAELIFTSVAGASGNGTKTVTVPAAGFSELVVFLGEGNDSLAVQSLDKQLTVFAGTGTNIIKLGDTLNRLDSIDGPTIINGQDGTDTLLLNDQGNSTLHSYTVTASTVARDGMSQITYNSMENVTLSAGTTSDTFYIRGTAAGTTTTVNGGSGGDRFYAYDDRISAPLYHLLGLLHINGQAGGGNDWLYVNDSGDTAAQTYSLSATSVVASRGNVYGGPVQVNYSGMENLLVTGGDRLLGGNTFDVNSTANGSLVTLTAGAGSDLIRMVGGPAVLQAQSLTINGGGGTNTLDYSTYTTDVTVNLGLGTGTGQAYLQKLWNVTGGTGNDILVGDGNANVLRGNGGRDLLFGGAAPTRSWAATATTS